MQRARAAFVALAAFGLGGCGTVCNLATGDPDLYGGVQKDVQFIQTPRKVSGIGVSPMTVAFLAPADLCLSLVADTLTLPLAVCLRQNHHPGDGAGVTDRGGKAAGPAGPAPGEVP
jgi:uncharacterized protein YceK